MRGFQLDEVREVMLRELRHSSQGQLPEALALVSKTLRDLEQGMDALLLSLRSAAPFTQDEGLTWDSSAGVAAGR